MLCAAQGPEPDLISDNLWPPPQCSSWAWEWCYDPRFNWAIAKLGWVSALQASEWFLELRFCVAYGFFKQFVPVWARERFSELHFSISYGTLK